MSCSAWLGSLDLALRGAEELAASKAVFFNSFPPFTVGCTTIFKWKQTHCWPLLVTVAGKCLAQLWSEAPRLSLSTAALFCLQLINSQAANWTFQCLGHGLDQFCWCKCRWCWLIYLFQSDLWVLIWESKPFSCLKWEVPIQDLYLWGSQLSLCLQRQKE